ncbi:MAG: ABC transporter ATP-binding protein [Defluviitaleaceae bacterium]|nr:ABC transporter ATP-binding protein [Defluviitaleaceae bacterium]
MSRPILQVNNLVKRYSSADINAVDEINFEVSPGELFCLLGVNGAGKSTTINMICTLIAKTGGNITLNGLTLGKDDDAIRKSIGVVFQGSVLDSVLTVEENVLSRAAFYGLDKTAAKKRLNYLAQRLSMTDFLNRRYARLSGGQRRKCDIARALLAEPKILFLDEPTTGLDPQSRIELWETIEEIRKESQMTVFLTTHYMEETEHSDRVAIMDAGKVLVIDTPQRLKTEYSSDTLRLVVKPGCNAQLEQYLQNYELVADTYIVKMKNGTDSIEMLPQVRPYLDSFEMEKGNMDSVFLNVVGRAAQ